MIVSAPLVGESTVIYSAGIAVLDAFVASIAIRNAYNRSALSCDHASHLRAQLLLTQAYSHK
jgi:hypothetical protein